MNAGQTLDATDAHALAEGGDNVDLFIAGEETFSTPSVLSPESYKELADRIEIILRRLKRRSDAEAALRE
jgi:hypothetical protein